MKRIFLPRNLSIKGGAHSTRKRGERWIAKVMECPPGVDGRVGDADCLRGRRTITVKTVPEVGGLGTRG